MDLTFAEEYSAIRKGLMHYWVQLDILLSNIQLLKFRKGFGVKTFC